MTESEIISVAQGILLKRKIEHIDIGMLLHKVCKVIVETATEIDGQKAPNGFMFVAEAELMELEQYLDALEILDDRGALADWNFCIACSIVQQQCGLVKDSEEL